jgi:hypothetical protein
MALTLTFGVGCDPPLGNNARITVSQNAIRKRNRMICPQVVAAIVRRIEADPSSKV